ncbi:hypothetical protein AVEN_69575-1 [Araneus ventricosus]|uniref:Uncharacterized protein n=1 Tax=Araneus ventricosus TaxID=182803 RepID=A0A4Y2H9G7_ARAVE|nr:hypothetical protein AVEN_69575-1 [Araneus ventricosus]
MSLQILFLCCANFSDIFAVVSYALGFSDYPDALVILSVMVFGTLNFVSFFATSYFAAEVSREDEKIRKRIKTVAFNSSVKKDNKVQGDLLQSFLQSKAEIVLSAGGVMNFSRGFLLTSAGVLISYNLLLIQLNTVG